MGAGVGTITAALPRRRTAITDKKNVSDTENGRFSHQHLQSLGGKDNDNTHGSLSASSPYLPYWTFGSSDGRSRIHSSPERMRRGDSQVHLNRVPEDGTMDFEHDEGPRYTDEPPLDEDEQEEEDELELDVQLAAQGLYRGSYPRLMALYTFAPFTWIVTFVFLALLPFLVYPIDQSIPHPPTFPYAPYLPFPVPEFLVAVALWSFTYLIQEPIYLLFTAFASPFPFIPATLTLLLSTAVHTVISTLVQLSAIPLLLISQYQILEYPAAWDPAFRRVWWAALGWSTAEAVVGIKQGYESIAMYKDVLGTVHRSAPPQPGRTFSGLASSVHEHSANNTPKSSGANASLRAGTSDIDLLDRDVEDDVYAPRSFYEDGERDPLLPQRSGSARHEFELEDALKTQVDRDIDRLIALRNREELEEIYGIPVIRIPVFISCLQRVNSVLLTLGVYLVLSSAYLRSTIAISSSSTATHGSTKTNTPLLITLPLVLLLRYSLALLHTSLVLPRIGVHTVAYVGSLVSLGIFFAGLGVWDALS